MIAFLQLMERVSMKYFYIFHQCNPSDGANLLKGDLSRVYEPMSFRNNKYRYQLFYSNDQVYIETNVVDNASRQGLLLMSDAEKLDLLDFQLIDHEPLRIQRVFRIEIVYHLFPCTFLILSIFLSC